MRKEPYSVDSLVHVIHRGTRGTSIARDAEDKDRFLLMLAHFNDEYQPFNWFRDIYASGLSPFERPDAWPDQKKLVHIVAFCLLDNHFHLLLKEIQDGGISKFMQRLGTGMSSRYNVKYEEKGSLFQGSFRARTVHSDTYLRYVLAYIQLKNALDACGVSVSSEKDFEHSYTIACEYPYSSLGDHVGAFKRPIIETDFLVDIFPQAELKEFSKDFLLGRVQIDKDDQKSIYFE